MDCDKYLELLSLRLDGALTEAEEQELEAHLKSCPACRAAGAQLAALQPAFAELEEVEVPEGFAQGVMDRVRGLEAEKKVVPLFRRPRLRALAGLAACAVLAVGLYGAVQQQKQADGEDLMFRSLTRDVVEEEVPMITAYPDTDTLVEGAVEDLQCEMARKSAPDATADYDGIAAVQAAPMVNKSVLTVERMPEGGWELISPEMPVSPERMYVTEEVLEQVEQLAQEQGITASITTNEEETEEFIIVVLEEIK